MREVKSYKPGAFEPENHWYEKALNATLHPMVGYFLNLGNDRIIERYCHLNPKVKKSALEEILATRPKYFRWAGADLINVTNENGNRNMVVIENNSCPSGQKSMPLLHDHEEHGGYKELIERTFLPSLKGQRLISEGKLAVLYDKNPMEASGYAATIADILDEEVFYLPFKYSDLGNTLKYKNGVLYFLNEKEEWTPIKAAFRYVTQKPWNRLPIITKTKILNPVLACLAGGRNKMMAAKAYDIFNAELQGTGLKIVTPETIWDVNKNEIPIWVKKMGGQAVIKVPYSNAGQGVYTIVSQKELDDFMAEEFEYDRFIVQSLIGNYNWSSMGSKGKLYHVGTIPNTKGQTFVTDVRMMVSASVDGLKPLCVYSRRSKEPLTNELTSGSNSWDMLGTNLSVKLGDNQWGSETNRLVLMDRRDFNKLGIGVDDLIEGYIQTVLSMLAIDSMCKNLINANGKFRKRLFSSLNDDPHLISEIYKE
ncbi:ATP-grasp domain-containing protein [Portibacter lacus]|uniref:Uncharacterized protein n=1 Tax=Portibacter lacus TaxID=1099794 RepID=A0AA37WGJ9_9BACT|nr:hypothetical protein [Portibacter lacus]GLR20082.1 hypothetical protein GCM10007940_46980 [Portibacter lacus]